MSPVTGLTRLPGRILLPCCSYGKFQRGRPGMLIRILLKWKYRHWRKKLCHFRCYVAKKKLFHFHFGYPGWSVHAGKFSSLWLPRDLRPAGLLIWSHRDFCEWKSGEARSRKPNQPGRPSLYEEALKLRVFHLSSQICGFIEDLSRLWVKLDGPQSKVKVHNMLSQRLDIWEMLYFIICVDQNKSCAKEAIKGSLGIIPLI